jgi:ABC-type branched-subunit amino acid transport system ATPase component
LILRVVGLSKKYGGVPALEGVSLELREGEVVGMIGPNGSGKTTLLDLVCGFIKPDMGRIYLNGMDVTDWKPFKIASLGVARTFQITKVFKKMTVMENMLAARRDPDKAYRLLRLVELDGLRDEYAENLSGGQQKLLEFVRSLMLEPRLLLMDEPMAGVTPVIMERLVELIKDVNRRGVTFLIVEHNISVVARLCERCLVLNNGRLIAEGNLEAIRNHPEVKKAYLGE